MASGGGRVAGMAQVPAHQYAPYYQQQFQGQQRVFPNIFHELDSGGEGLDNGGRQNECIADWDNALPPNRRNMSRDWPIIPTS
ncbi:hypothetical protein GCM10022409_16270 [Hymenobacter glaciei]|uniref:Uncharacterized protein n=1 Tax=Hymenobacter glaciei TaxID=877209 RepID=A0ABP7TXM9_9BACT